MASRNTKPEKVETESKSDKMVRAAQAALQIVAAEGLEELSFTKVSRAAGVSRPWLYKYIGKSPKSLTDFAVDQFARVFAQMDQRPRTSKSDHWIEDVVKGTNSRLSNTSDHPWMSAIYFRYANSKSSMGERIRETERRYLKSVSAEIQTALKMPSKKADVMAELLVALRLGLRFKWLIPESRKTLSDFETLDGILTSWFRAGL